MSAHPPPAPSPAPKLAAVPWYWAAAVLFLVAGALRLYRLGADPLWYDEVISTQVARSGLGGLLANSLSDPHPPLYYLLLWLTSGFGAAQAEWAWRWPSALAGALSVPALFVLARRVAGAAPAFLAALWLAFNPTAVYFSQEVRWPALTMLLALLLMLAFAAVLAAPSDRRRWALYAALAGVGLFTSYSFLMIVGVQLPVVLWAVRRERRAWLLALALLGLLAAQAALGVGVLAGIAAEHATSRALLLKEIVQSLVAGDVFRYGSFWPHRYTVLLLGGLAALGGWRLVRAAPRWQRLYPLAQFAAPLAAYGLVLSPLLDVNLPNYETRQFLVLLPALYLLAAHGLAQVWAGLPRPAAWVVGLALSAVVLAGSVQGLGRYWAGTRSPEGQAVRFLAPQLAPGDAVVALDYFSASAVRYYLPDQLLFMRPTLTPAGLHFWQATGPMRYHDDTDVADVPLAVVRDHPRFWVLSVPGRLEEHVAVILAGCQVAATTDISWLPLRVQLVTGCAPGAAP